MQYAAFDSRSRQILDYLADQSDYKSVPDIAGHLTCSRNSVQYCLVKIANLLKEQRQDSFDKKRKAGIRLTAAHKAWWQEFQKNQADLDYTFTRDERIALLICLLIMERGRFSIENTALLLHVSRNTLFADLRGVKEILASYHVRLAYDTRTGYSLTGSEFTLRSLLVHYFLSLQALLSRGILEPFDAGAFLKHKNAFAGLQEELMLEYVPGVIDKLALLMLYMESGNASPAAISRAEAADIRTAVEYETVCRLFPDLAEEEKLYLSSQLLGSRILHPYTHVELSDQQSLAHAQNMVSYFERITGLLTSNNEGLLHELATHVSRALYRYKYSIALPHLSAEESTESMDPEYSELYAVIRLVAEEFSRDIGYPIDETETILLASYFFRHLQHLPLHIPRTSALLIVDGDPAAYASLARDITANFPMLDVGRIVTPGEFYQNPPPDGLLVSTVSLRTRLPYALVPERLDRQSRDAVFQCYQQYRMGRSLSEVDDLLRRLEPYLAKDGFHKAKNEILAFLYGKSPSLHDIMLPEYVSARLAADGWENAVRLASAPLVEAGAVTGEYVEEAVRAITMYGSYSYIFDGVYLVHADAVREVNRLALGVATLAAPVLFPGDKPVSVLLILCPRDKHTHFTAFKELMGLCGQEGIVDALLQTADTDDVLRILSDAS